MIALKYNVQRVIFPGYSQEWYPVIHKLCTYHPFWATVCKTVRPTLSDRCLSCLWRWSIVAKWLDGSRLNLACR